MTPRMSSCTLAGAMGVSSMHGSEADGRTGDGKLDLVVSCVFALACGLVFEEAKTIAATAEEPQKRP
jgi:hypothetical protein